MLRRVRPGKHPASASLHVVEAGGLLAQRRFIIVPRQIKAYGGALNQAKGGTMGLDSHRFLIAPKKVEGKRVTKCITEFKEMLLPSAVVTSLAEMGVTTPSPVQQTAIPAIARREDTIVTSPAGSGKTLAVLAPIFASMMKDRDIDKVPLRERRPRCMIFAPTTELAEQLFHVCRKLGESTGIKTVALTHKHRAKHHHKLLLNQHMPDVIIASPHLAERLVRSRRLFIDDLRHVVLDEADTLMSKQHDGFGAKMIALARRRSQYKHLWPVQTQTVMMTATFTQLMAHFRDVHLPRSTLVAMPHVHEIGARVHQRFFKMSRNVDKWVHLLDLLKQGGNTPTPWTAAQLEGDSPMVHEWHPLPPNVPLRLTSSSKSNPTPTVGRDKSQHDEQGTPTDTDAEQDRDMVPFSSAANAVVSWTNPAGLSESDITKPSLCIWEHQTARSGPFTGAVRRVVMVPGERVMIFFKSIDRATAIYYKLHREGYKVALVHGMLPTKVRREMFERWASGQCNIVCCTDVLARGADYLVDRVINFDCPLSPVDYLHRIGRTARMGRQGKVSTLFTKFEEQTVDILRMFAKGAVALENVSHFTKQVLRPTYAQYKGMKRDAVARNYIKLISTRIIPAHKMKTFMRTRATWRPLFHPSTVEHHGGVPVTLQNKYMDKVMHAAVWRRREILAQRKGGRAKFGRHKHTSEGKQPYVVVQGVTVAGPQTYAPAGTLRPPSY